MNTKTRKIVASLFLIISINANLAAQKNEYAKIIDSLQKQSKNIQYRKPDSATLVFGSLANYYKLDGNISEYHKTLILLANSYLILHNTDEALRLYLQCNQYFNQTKDSSNLYSSYCGIAGVYYDLKNSEKAIIQLELATQVCNEKKFPDLKFVSLVNLANCYIMAKKYDLALKSYDNAQRLIAFVKNPNYIYHLKMEYAYLFYLKHQYNQSIKYAEAVILANADFDKRLTMRANYILGLSYLELKEYAKCRSYFNKAVWLSRETNLTKDSYEFLRDVVRLDTTIGDYKSAVKMYDSVMILKDSLFEINKTKLTEELLIKYETQKKEYENKFLEKENEKRTNTIKWQRILIICVIILSIATISILYFYLRYRNKLQKKAIEKEQIQTELKALKAQLNPHFIHNIFQIISTRVKTNPDEVSDFLQKTANYFRIVLKGTDKSVQSLEDEISFTQHYLEFQQSLFGSKLNFSFDIADDVDTYGILIPAMILQPFVENCIKHGLQKSSTPVTIKISVTKNDSFLQILIADDAVNFNNSSSTAKEQSFGNTLIERRLDLFYKNAIIKPKLVAYANENNKGFSVNISLPL